MAPDWVRVMRRSCLREVLVELRAPVAAGQEQEPAVQVQEPVPVL